MYIKRVEIHNIRAVKAFDWSIESGQEAGWHVLLGNNGAGKSTVLKAIACAVLGERGALSVVGDEWDPWLSGDSPNGQVKLKAESLPEQGSPQTLEAEFGLEINRGSGIRNLYDSVDFRESGLFFASSFGPVRRVSKDGEHSFSPEAARHLPLFRNDIGLPNVLKWLQNLDYMKKDGDAAGALVDDVVAFINQDGFLPNEAKLDKINSRGVMFQDANHQEIPFHDLSDGFRSILSLTLEVIRQMAETNEGGIFSSDKSLITKRGLVMIDEIDAHLHPSWQKKIGFWLTKHFPNVQFLVTTHSPLVCWAAERGSVWYLPEASEEKEPFRIEGADLQRLLYGDINEAMSSSFFGRDVFYSEKAVEKRNRLAELNQKALFEDLTETEAEEQQALRKTFPTKQNRLRDRAS